MSRLLKFISFGKPIHPEVVPLLAIMGVAITGVSSFCIYALFTKNDVMLNHHDKIPPWEKTIDEVNPKLLNLHPLHKLDPEIRKLKEEINQKSA
ncbi:hypothetical protein GHT06_019807 [Daphnia sinensis]|uniref:Uncharacterized protein n=1 Tax=Daphnia sinensis TaxID=1820382 RepID=A0AAD5PRR3_9CRUS|nr:hypothetical protein GHT06_019807 [Daphnia sinensis]